MDKCDICKKKLKFVESVLYSGDYETILCKGCQSKWLKNNECIDLNRKYKKAKPTTKQWYKKCAELQEAFNVWFKAQKFTTPEKAGHNYRKKKGSQ